MLNFLSDDVAIAALLLATLLVLILFGLVVSAALRGGPQSGKADAGKPLRLLGAESLRQSFRSAVELIEANLAARGERYSLSWTLLLNDSGKGPLPLAQSGLPSALSADSTLRAAGQGIGWHFFDRGVVVQLQADHLGAADGDGAAGNGVWDDFLGLCRGYRPQRPFDSIVLAVPCAALLQADPQGRLDLVARAKAIHRRLWLAQNRLALRFPIYLVVSGCDALPGFATFGAALPEPLRRSMLGWSSPYELVAPFRVQWVDSAVDDIVGTAAERCAELCALEPAGADSSAYFMLPGELERLRAGLKVFCEELMRPSAYHEPFLLRGLYLTGDCSDAAALAAAPVPPLDAIEAGALAEIPAPADRMPVFLRDIFERKVFAEAGLVQSAAQRLRRPAASRAARWAGLALPALWGVALLVDTVRLHHLATDLVGNLDALNRDSRASLRSGPAGAHDARYNPQRGQQRATDALLNIEQLGAARFSSLFMPGSWPLFDDLHGRVVARLEQGFADNAFDPLRRAAFSRLSRLTGVPVDPVTGALIGGAQCTLPAGWNEQAGAPAASALNLEDLPQFAATLAYLARVEELDRVLGAMLRLKGPDAGPASGADLALVVRVLLGAELTGVPTRTAALFRAVARREPSLALKPMREAARCALQQATRAMYGRLFDDNGLLRTERLLADSMAGLPGGADPGTGLAGQLQAWRSLRDALDLQQRQLAGGKGAWIRHDILDLGAAHEAMIARIGANSLLGGAAARDTRQLAAEGFGRLKVTWSGVLSGPGSLDGTGAGGGLAWTGAAWTFSPGRKAMHEAVAALLAQPWMTVPPPVQFPAPAPGAAIGWDKALLDQAAHLAEARKNFQAGPYAALPAGLQQGAAGLADGVLAAHAHSLLARAAIALPGEPPGGAADAGRTGVLRIRAWLLEIGSVQAADELDAVLVRDALARLQRLDEVFTAAEVFVPRDGAFRGWTGDKEPLLDAFGAGDAAGLAAYVARQQEFVDTAAAQAEGMLAQLAHVSVSHPLAARWQAIVADVRRYRLKSPASSLVAIEQFIAGAGAQVDLANCAGRLAARGSRLRNDDVFAERLQGLQAGLLARCRELTAERYRNEWDRFAQLYNRDLARHAPFATLPGTGATPADPDAVGAAMKQYDRARAAGMLARREQEQEQERERDAAAGAPARADGEQLRRMRDVLAPLYPAEPGQAAGLDVTAQFRAAGAAEAAANQIIDWSLTIGNATVRLADPPRALRWEPGMPVLLALRMARDGAGIPASEPGHRHMSVADRTVSYRFDDPWALFSFINAHRVGDGDGRAALLRFEFPLAHAVAGAPVAALPDTRARVFLRLNVSVPGKRAPLAWPAAFPAHVPGWQEMAQNMAQNMAQTGGEAPSRPPLETVAR